MSLFTLKLAAARHVLGAIQAEELPLIADEVITRGVCSPALAELWLTRNPTLRDSAPLLEKALREVGIPLPTKAEAASTVAKYLIIRIVEGSILPSDGVRRLAEEICGWQPAQSKEKLNVRNLYPGEEARTVMTRLREKGGRLAATRQDILHRNG